MKTSNERHHFSNLFRKKRYAENVPTYLVQYQQALQKELDDRNQLIHDFKKHLNTLSYFAQEGDLDSIQNYLQQLIDHPAFQKQSKLCDHHLLNSILNHYRDICISNQILLETDIRQRTLFFLTDMDLTELFCNILENAITACQPLDKRWIRLYISKENHITTINLRNTCAAVYSENDISPVHPGIPAKHGNGLRIVERIAKKYHGTLDVYRDTNQGVYYTLITLREL